MISKKFILLSIIFHLSILYFSSFFINNRSSIHDELSIDLNFPEISNNESIENDLKSVNYAQTLNKSDLDTEIAALYQFEAQYETLQQTKIKNLENQIEKIEQKKNSSEKKIKELLDHSLALENQSKSLSKNLEMDKKKHEKLKKEIDETKKEMERMEQIQELSKEIFNESVKNDVTLISNYRKKIAYHLSSYWKVPAHHKDNVKCILNVQILPNGDVLKVSIAETSGDTAFDQHAINAVYKSSPLPALEQLSAKERPRQLTMTFVPESVLAMESF